MLTQFTEFVLKNDLCSKSQPVFVAASGGIDSMVLLHLFVSAGFNVSAAHMNFNLRGKESDEDEAFVKERCGHLAIPFIRKAVATKNYATERGMSVQMAARALRYEWFSELIRLNAGSVIATAHHVNDSGETMLLNLIRGTGIDGLTGIPMKNDGVIRPLSFATRKQIEQYAAAHAITWREDESNLDDHYQRNFIRHRVMRLLRQINPSIEETLLRNSTRLGGERELLERSLAGLKEDFIVDDDGTVRISKEGLKEFIHRSGVLMRMIEPFGFNFATAESIVAALEGQPGKKFFSPTHQLVVDREHLIISVPDHEASPVAVTREGSLGKLTLTIRETSDKTPGSDPSTAYIDKDKVTLPLLWRKWKEGDSFHPLGMKGSKKLSDFFIDEKIPVTEKQSATVLTSGSEIVWVVGKRIDDRFRITGDTKTVLVIEVKKTPDIVRRP